MNPVILFIFVVLYTFIAKYYNLKSKNIPPEMFIAIVSFSAVFIGFILVYAMSRYDVNQNSYKDFISKIVFLQSIYPSYSVEINEFLQSYMKRIPYDSLGLEKNLFSISNGKDIITETRVSQTFTVLNALFTIRMENRDNIPSSIWLVLFFVLIMASFLMISDGNIPLFASIIVLLVIWMPSLVVYHLYNTRI